MVKEINKTLQRTDFSLHLKNDKLYVYEVHQTQQEDTTTAVLKFEMAEM